MVIVETVGTNEWLAGACCSRCNQNGGTRAFIHTCQESKYQFFLELVFQTQFILPQLSFLLEELTSTSAPVHLGYIFSEGATFTTLRNEGGL
jgi:hypothetical protein